MQYSPALAKLLNRVRRNADGSIVLSDLSPLQVIELQKIMDGERLLAHGTTAPWEQGYGPFSTYLTPSIGHAYRYALPGLPERHQKLHDRARLHLFQPRSPSLLDTAPTKEDSEAWHQIIHPLRRRSSWNESIDDLDEVMSQPLWRLINVGDTAWDLERGAEVPTFVDQYVVPSPLEWLDKLFERKAQGGRI